MLQDNCSAVPWEQSFHHWHWRYFSVGKTLNYFYSFHCVLARTSISNSKLPKKSRFKGEFYSSFHTYERTAPAQQKKTMILGIFIELLQMGQNYY